MPHLLAEHPGLWFVAATLLPLISVVLLLLSAFLRNALRQAKNSGGLGAALFQLLGGEVTGRGPAYIATGAIGLAFVCSAIGFFIFVTEPPHDDIRHISAHDHGHEHKEKEKAHPKGAQRGEKDKDKSVAALNIARAMLATAKDNAQAVRETKLKAETNLSRLEESVKMGQEAPATLEIAKVIIASVKVQEQIADGELSFAEAKLEELEQVKDNHPKVGEPKAKVAKEKPADKHDAHDDHEEHGSRWKGSFTWASITSTAKKPDPEKATSLKIGYYIDSLSAIMFVMVTFIATLIHLFSIGYMADELQTTVEDHQVHTEHGHFHRRGRFGRFFLFLSLFCFSMLNLILADNLFQVFVSWELVGVCSYLLVGFYYERTSAANAANKAFITNRVGDAGFIIGLLIVWSYVGTLNFQEVFERIRCPVLDESRIEAILAEEARKEGKKNDGAKKDSRVYQPLKQAWQIVRANLEEPIASNGDAKLEVGFVGESGSYAVLFPRHAEHAVFDAPASATEGRPRGTIEAKKNPGLDEYGYIPYWMLVVAGLGIFLGCVGKSAQFPLHVWLPDAMEGPTPVSALIHAATMVAAGVYLVGRCFPLFTFEVTLTIAYVGAITLFMAATIAVVMNDIKKVLAYSTVSQLGYMMLGLGVGGWVPGLFHLVTHAFFKALLFLGSGSVIYGCHHEQDMRKMGGLYPKMKITALAMLMGVLAISGIPLFSGWYSKDAVIAHAYGFITIHPDHLLLFLLPLFTAGLTTFYMFRMWYLTFCGKPRDEHVYEHAHESPWTMTVPLILLAFFSVTVAWGAPIHDPEASFLDHMLHHSQPSSVKGDFGGVRGEEGNELDGESIIKVEIDGKTRTLMGPSYKELPASPRAQAHNNHGPVGLMALGLVVIGLIFASLIYLRHRISAADAIEEYPGVNLFLQHKWYFDELYSAILVRPGLVVAGWARWFDIHVIDGFVHTLGKGTVIVSFLSGRGDRNIVDGLANLIADVCQWIGNRLRRLQTGYLRSYVLFLVLAALGLWILLNAYYLGAAQP